LQVFLTLFGKHILVDHRLPPLKLVFFNLQVKDKLYNTFGNLFISKLFAPIGR